MTIQRRAPEIIPKRQADDIVKKHERIGELLNLEKVPVHTLAWKEARLELGSDCYPLIDVLEKMAEKIHELSEKPKPLPKKAGRPKKVE